jgi:hypothetical protein
MSWHPIVLLAAFAAPLVSGLASTAAGSEAMRISGPFTHENIALYFFHGPSAPGPVPLTLQEALERGQVTVFETGSVSQLSIENTGSEEVFVQAGDIVKGGRQDRVLTVSLVLPPKSGKMNISAYCVERGRWAQRGSEHAGTFASATSSMPSRDAKLAILTPPPERQQAQYRPAGEEPSGLNSTLSRIQIPGLPDGGGAISRQSEVWASVADAQRKLSANLGAPVAAPQSASSLQLSLENERLAEARAAYTAALKAAGESADDIVGYAFAINGQINSAEMYPSNGLFRKMWPKLLEASTTEAIAEKSTAAAPAPAAPPADTVRSFLTEAEKGRARTTPLGDRLVREARDADKAVYMETARSAGGFIHRSYVAK